MTNRVEEANSKIEVAIINGVEGPCVSVNNFRICGPKPWGGGSVEHSWKTSKENVLRAFLTPEEDHEWLTQGLRVVSATAYDSTQQELKELREGIQAALDYLVEEQRRSVFEHSAHDEANVLLANRLRALLKKE